MTEFAAPGGIDCPRAKTWMTPCAARDGKPACADDGGCVGCDHDPAELLVDLSTRYQRLAPLEPSDTDTSIHPADRLTAMVTRYVGPPRQRRGHGPGRRR